MENFLKIVKRAGLFNRELRVFNNILGTLVADIMPHLMKNDTLSGECTQVLSRPFIKQFFCMVPELLQSVHQMSEIIIFMGNFGI